MLSSIEGTVDPRFERVRESFAEGFAQKGEVGAAISVWVDGDPVADLWGGFADPKSGRLWQHDTLQMIYSSTKGVASVCAHMLAARNLLDLEAPVARYWPEFAAEGKESIPVAMLLDHQAGLPAIDERLPPEAMYDWERMTSAIAKQKPHWSPGDAHGYHPFTFGFLVGELVYRITGKSIGKFLRDEVSGPLGLDLWIGLPAECVSRMSRVLGPPLPENRTVFELALADRTSLSSRAFLNPRTFFVPKHPGSREMLSAEIPAANGVATARGLAGMYSALVDSPGRLIPRADVEAMSVLRSDGRDLVLLRPTRFSLGFMKTMPMENGSGVRFGPNDEAFGHVGAGGSFGMADPVANIAVAYVMNQMGSGTLLNERGQLLIDAVYDSLA